MGNPQNSACMLITICRVMPFSPKIFHQKAFLCNFSSKLCRFAYYRMKIHIVLQQFDQFNFEGEIAFFT